MFGAVLEKRKCGYRSQCHKKNMPLLSIPGKKHCVIVLLSVTAAVCAVQFVCVCGHRVCPCVGALRDSEHASVGRW